MRGCWFGACACAAAAFGTSIAQEGKRRSARVVHPERVQTASPLIDSLRDQIEPLRQRLHHHPLYASIQTIGQLRRFMESHVFAVWDFMSLLKSLQQQVTCVTVPWMPSAYPHSRRFINEIVLGEESDVYQDRHLSHFEMYLEAMEQAGADTSAIAHFLRLLSAGESIPDALRAANAPEEAAAFVSATFASLTTDRPHVVAGAFTFGREDLIPGMFISMVRELKQQVAGVGVFLHYLERHIEVDGEDHGPMAIRMMDELCGTDALRWEQATTAASHALEARLALWDGIRRSLPDTR